MKKVESNEFRNNKILGEFVISNVVKPIFYVSNDYILMNYYYDNNIQHP
jgi:hypothetical protein